MTCVQSRTCLSVYDYNLFLSRFTMGFFEHVAIRILNSLHAEGTSRVLLVQSCIQTILYIKKG